MNNDIITGFNMSGARDKTAHRGKEIEYANDWHFDESGRMIV